MLLGVRLMEGGLGRRRPLSGTHSGLCRGGTGGRADPRTVPGAQALHWRQITVAAELLLLAAVAFLPAALDNAANVLVAFCLRGPGGELPQGQRQCLCHHYIAPETCAAARAALPMGEDRRAGPPDTRRPSTTALSCFSLSERHWGPGAAAGGGRGRCWGACVLLWRPFAYVSAQTPCENGQRGIK